MLHNTWHHLKRQRLALLGGSIVTGLIIVALLAPSDPLEQNLYQRLEPPSLVYPLGTDDFGCDILSRVIYGSRIFVQGLVDDDRAGIGYFHRCTGFELFG